MCLGISKFPSALQVSVKICLRKVCSNLSPMQCDVLTQDRNPGFSFFSAPALLGARGFAARHLLLDSATKRKENDRKRK